MLQMFHELPDLAILLIVVAVVASVSTMAPWFGRHVLRLRQDTRRGEAASDVFKTVMAMSAFLLAFSLVQAEGTLRDLHETNVKPTPIATTLIVMSRRN